MAGIEPTNRTKGRSLRTRVGGRRLGGRGKPNDTKWEVPCHIPYKVAMARP